MIDKLRSYLSTQLIDQQKFSYDILFGDNTDAYDSYRFFYHFGCISAIIGCIKMLEISEEGN